MRDKKNRQNVLVSGSAGRMGREICSLLTSHPQLVLGASVDRNEIKAHDLKHTAVLKPTQSSLNAVMAGVDVVIDFSTPDGTRNLIKSLSKETGKCVLIGTTGLDKKIKSELQKVARAGDHKILVAGNTSVGVFTLAKLAVSAAKLLAPLGFDIEITETHHRMKADAPSGTALLLADVIQSALPSSVIEFNRRGTRKKNSIGIHSVRGGGVFGEHDIRLISDDEELSIGHRAFSRALFAKGALSIALEIKTKVPNGKAMELSEFILAKN
jgi:4-hydroxy-tetrahydrodipicolinate reductase